MELPDPVRQRLSNLSLTMFGDAIRTGPESSEAAGEWPARAGPRGGVVAGGRRPRPGEKWRRRLRLPPRLCPTRKGGCGPAVDPGGREPRPPQLLHPVALSPSGLACRAGTPSSLPRPPLRSLGDGRPAFLDGEEPARPRLPDSRPAQKLCWVKTPPRRGSMILTSQGFK